MKTILVPTDFSPNANKASDFAVQIAKPASAKIIVVHACDLPDLTFQDHIKMKEEHCLFKIQPYYDDYNSCSF